MIHHIEIYVSQLKQTRAFYDFLLKELKYELYQEWDQGFSYIYQDTYLVFVQTEDKYLEHGYHRKNIGLNHIAFSVKTKKEVDVLRQQLLDRNVKELYADQYPNAGGNDYYAFYFEDPDRIKCEIVSLE